MWLNCVADVNVSVWLYCVADVNVSGNSVAKLCS